MRLLLVGLELVVLGLQAGRPKDRLAKPLQAEHEQEAADGQPQDVDRKGCDRGAEYRHDRGQRQRRGAGAADRRTPATGGAHGQDDGERLDRLDGAGEEDRYGQPEVRAAHVRGCPDLPLIQS